MTTKKKMKKKEVIFSKNFWKFLVDITLVKRKSIKDEINLIKNIKPMAEEEELPMDMIAQTMKNTLYNKVVGKISEEGEK